MPAVVVIAVLCKISCRFRTNVLQRQADVVISGVIKQAMYLLGDVLLARLPRQHSVHNPTNCMSCCFASPRPFY